MTMKVALLVIVVLFSSGHTLRSQSSGQVNRVRVIGLIKLKLGREAEFEALATRMVSRTKREDRGNIRYEFFRASAPLAQCSGPITRPSITYFKRNGSIRNS